MKTINRRTFLGAAAVSSAALGNLVTRAANAAADTPKLKLGLIGCGWYGMVDVKAAFKAGGVEVVALCDVDSEHLTQSTDEVAKLQGQRPQTFKLYADLLQTPGLAGHQGLFVLAEHPGFLARWKFRRGVHHERHNGEAAA